MAGVRAWQPGAAARPPIQERRRGSRTQLVRDAGGRHHLVFSLATRDDTQIVSIDPETGRLGYAAAPGIDLFPTPEDAADALRSPETLAEGVAVVGYRVLGGHGLLLMVTEAAETLLLPPAHRVMTVTATRWLKVPLRYTFAPLSRAESKCVSTLTSYLPGSAFYYCETHDLSHLFPNTNPPCDYNAEWVWNHALRRPFAEIGLGAWCVVLLQGLAQSQRITDRDLMNECTVAMVTRRSSLNPSSRHLSEQGLSEYAAPGNECETELVVYTLRERPLQQEPLHPYGAKWVKEVRWASHVIRRGAPPVRWQQERAGPRVAEKEPFAGCGDYWRRVMRRYGGGTPVVCVSMLRRSRPHPEQRLGVAFDMSLVHARKTLNLAGCEVRHFDLQQLQEQKGADAAATALCAEVSKSLTAHGVSAGELDYGKTHGALVGVRRSSQQRGVLRLSCTDGLRRTDLAAFLVTVQAAAELGRRVGVQHASHKWTPGGTAAGAADDSEWPLLGIEAPELKSAMSPAMLEALVALSAANSDACAGLDQRAPARDTPAAASRLGGLFSRLSEMSVVQAATALAKRVAAAAAGDAVRETTQRELLLSHAVARYFPSLGNGGVDEGPRTVRDQRVRVLSRSPACAVLRRVPCMFRTHPRAEEVLVSPTPTEADPVKPWPVPGGIGVCVLSVLLPEPCRVTELSVTLRHGGAMLLSPLSMDVYVGVHADACTVAMAGAEIPMAPDGTTLTYTLPSHLSGLKPTTTVAKGYFHDFFGRPPPSQLRVVHVVFRSRNSSLPMLLGPVRVLGAPAEPAASTRADQIVPTVVPPAPAPPVVPHAAAVALAEEAKGTWRGTSLLFEGLVDALNELTVVPDRPPLSPSTKAAARDLDFALDLLRKVQEVDGVLPDSDDDDSDGLSDQLESPRGNASQSAAVTAPSPDPAVLPPRAAGAALRLYEEELMRLVPGSSSAGLSFHDALYLERHRLHLRVPSLLRDVLLWRIGHVPRLFDPASRTVRRDPTVEMQLRRRFAGAQCANPRCLKPLRSWGGLMQRKGQCKYCRQTFCRDCMSAERSSVIEYGWDQPEHELCLNCAPPLARQRTYVKSIADLSAKEQAGGQMEPWEVVTRKVFCADASVAPRRIACGASYDELMSGPYSIAESRQAAIFSTVPTHADSPPIEVVLHHHDVSRYDLAASTLPVGCRTPPLRSANPQSFWFAPDGVTSVQFDIVLPFVTHVTSVVLLCDALGYEDADRVRLSVHAGLTLDCLFPCGEWAVGVAEDQPCPEPVAPFQRIDLNLGNSPPDDGARVLRIGLAFVNEEPPAEVVASMRRRLHLGTVLVQGLPAPPWPSQQPVPHAEHERSAPPLPSSLRAQPQQHRSTRDHSPPPEPSRTGSHLWADEDAEAVLTDVVEDAIRQYQHLERVCLREEQSEWDASSWTLDLVLAPSRGAGTPGSELAGVAIVPRGKAASAPPSAQARDIRLLAFRSDGGDESMVIVGDIELPLVGPQTPLTYWIPAQREVRNVRRLRLEVLSVYGGRLPERPTLQAFVCPSLRRLRYLVEEERSDPTPRRQAASAFMEHTVQWYEQMQAKALALES
eukprot:TRINITY_DN19309_c0_g1_i1.p1 TRINITY_DN19309_c0_g1~~TRINITY_DN19309_c0_g1_i1.p1  ORF type:complete len:1593 (+),score=519.46 TRINITY_DN19309_c0_g1_i1:47-4780(+)